MTKVEVLMMVDGKRVDDISTDVRDKKNPFRTGSRGFYKGGKVAINGKVHQLSCSLVQVGTKPEK